MSFKLKGLCVSIGEQNLKKYHAESTNVSRVSVSLIAFIPVSGHFVNFHEGWFSRGLPGIVKSISSGSSNGNWSSGTSMISPSSLYIIGIGHPQYLCLDTPQSRSLKFVVFSPSFKLSILSIIFFFASSMDKSFKNSEFFSLPFPV